VYLKENVNFHNGLNRQYFFEHTHIDGRSFDVSNANSRIVWKKWLAVHCGTIFIWL